MIQASAKDSLAVFKGGKWMFGAEYLAKSMSDKQLAYGPCEKLPQEVCGQSKSLCGTLETKQSLVDFFSEHEDSHPLFSCDPVPKDEPSCVPQRPGEYTGLPADDDQDGDGILAAADNCPMHFNPLRPVDGSVQLDTDEDGLGEECDPCPLDKNQACGKIRLGDLDKDSILDSLDNCPLRYNQEQRDQDDDGLGDVCDACLDESNPDGICSATIMDVKNKRFPRGTKVRLQATVAGIEASASAKTSAWSLYLAHTDSNQETSPYGGIFVYRAKGDVTLGAQVQIAGVVDTFYGQFQLKPLKLTSLSGEPLSATPTLVEPISLSYLDLPSKESLTPEERNQWEGRLVRVENLVLSKKTMTDPETQEALEEILLDEQILLDPLFGLIKTQDLYEGDTFHVTGFLAFKGDRWALIPRDIQDLEISKALPAKLHRFSSEEVVMEDKTGQAMAPLSGPLFLELNKPAAQTGKVELRIDPAGIIGVEPFMELADGVKSLPILLQGLGNLNELPAGETLTLIATLDGFEVRTTIKVQSCASKANVSAATLATARLGKQEAMEFQVQTDLTAPRCDLDQAQPYELLDSEGKVLQSGVLTLTPGKTVHDLTLANSGNGDFRLHFMDSNLEHAFTIYPLMLRLTEVYYDHPKDDKGQEWIEIENTSGEDLDLSRFVLALARNKNYRDYVQPLSGTLPAGACYVIGQPDFVNFPATFGGEGITNGGKVADGIALFAFPAGASTMVEPDMLPHDSVLYGLENRLGLRNPDGTTDIHFAKDGTPGRSLSFGKKGWQMTKPSPGICNPPLRDEEDKVAVENTDEASTPAPGPSTAPSDDT
jgi:hypothetical protein